MNLSPDFVTGHSENWASPRSRIASVRKYESRPKNITWGAGVLIFVNSCVCSTLFASRKSVAITEILYVAEVAPVGNTNWLVPGGSTRALVFNVVRYELMARTSELPTPTAFHVNVTLRGEATSYVK